MGAGPGGPLAETGYAGPTLGRPRCWLTEEHGHDPGVAGEGHGPGAVQVNAVPSPSSRTLAVASNDRRSPTRWWP